MKVFLLAENRLLREALVKIFRKRDDITVVGENSFTPQALEQIVSLESDVLLMDSMTIGVCNHGFIREIRHAVPHLRVLMIGMEFDEATFLRVVQAGAMGYMLKDASASEVLAAVRAVARAEAVCPPGLCGVLFSLIAKQFELIGGSTRHFRAGLTRREQQLLPLISQGLTNKEIAAKLGLSEQTVKNHIHRILRKVGAEDRSAISGAFCASSLEELVGLHP